MKTNHEETKSAKIFFRSFFVFFVSSWLVFGGVVHVAMSDALKSLK
jgi:hypothetical protein